MTDRHTGVPTWRTVLAGTFGVVAVLLAGFAALVTWGVTEEYGAGMWPGEALLLAGIPAAVALLALVVVPLRGRVRGGALAAFVMVTVGALYAGHLLGVAGNQESQEAQSRNFACFRFTEARASNAFDTLPRPYPIYGPVEGSRSSCTAGVNGPGSQVLRAYRTALPQHGWELTGGAGRAIVAVRKDVTAKVYLDCGAATTDDQCTALVQIAVTGADDA